MKRKTLNIFLLTAVFALTGAGRTPPQAGRPEDPDWVMEVAAKRVVYGVPGMTRVGVRKNLTYKRADGAELKMDVYSPPGARGGARRPAVLFIHGGRIPLKLRTTPQDWGAYVSFGRLVAPRGLVGV